MIPLIRKTQFTIAFSLLACTLWGQDLYDKEHSQKFADYLYNTSDYNGAALEYERLLFLNPSDSTTAIMLIKSYRLGGRIDMAKTRFNSIFTDNIIPRQYSYEYVNILIENADYAEIRSFLEQRSNVDEPYKNNQITYSYLLEGRWSDASEFIEENEIQNNDLAGFVQKGENLRYKSPFLAATLSTVIPGLGKVYTKRASDGFLALAFVAGSSFAAYRGFSRDGVSSAYGWIFASIGTTYYLSNIYGSYKSAQYYNRNLDNDLQDEVRYYYYSH